MPAEAPAAAASTAAAAAVPERATRSFLLRGSLAAAGAALLAAAVPPAQAAGLPAASAEQVAAGAEGRVASIACIGGGREAALGVQRLGSGLVWDAQGHVVVPYAPLTRAVRASSTYEAQILVTLTAADGSRHELPVAVVARDPSHELIVLQAGACRSCWFLMPCCFWLGWREASRRLGWGLELKAPPAAEPVDLHCIPQFPTVLAIRSCCHTLPFTPCFPACRPPCRSRRRQPGCGPSRRAARRACVRGRMPCCWARCPTAACLSLQVRTSSCKIT